jgi:DNA ligase (NAD+)
MYREGSISYGATRGNGFVGEDVTQNTKTIANLPKQLELSGEIEVRGEVYMPIASFVTLNEERRLQEESVFANPRNAAAGSLRQLNPAVVASRNLKFFAYHIDSFGSELGVSTQIEALQLLQKLGFSVAQYCLCRNMDDIMRYYEKTFSIRGGLEYEIDGTVFKINSLRLQRELGHVGRNPRHSIAFKFPAYEAQTDIVDITITVGRTGKLTPVAILKPVTLSGATISRATLHNFEEIARKGLAIGDTITVSRSGDVIPKINAIVKKSGNNVYFPPGTCPSCGKILAKSGKAVDLFCTNYHGCPSQFERYVTYFVSKQCFDINGLGKKQIKEFIEEGRIKNVVDIFKLKEKDRESPLAQKPSWGTISVKKLYSSIERGRTITLPRFIISLAILGVGERIAQLLADKFETIQCLMNASEQDILEIDGVGGGIAQHIYTYMRDPSNLEFIDELLKYVTISEHKKVTIGDKTSIFFK